MSELQDQGRKEVVVGKQERMNGGREAGGMDAEGKQEVPLTVSVTSRSPAPTRGTTALHTYFPASSWRTDFRISLFSLLRT